MKRSRARILQVLRANRKTLRAFEVRKLGLFGSHARGRAGRSSDLDFEVELEHKSFDAYMDLLLFLEDLFGGKVDLVLSDAIKPRLRKTLLNETIYAPGEAAGR